jgi:excisionase family DNA binding protein
MLRPAYTASEAANLLRIGRAWLVQKAAEGQIPGAHRTGGDSGHWRFDPDKFDRYLQDLRAGKVITQPRWRKIAPRKPQNVEMQEWLARFKSPARKAG